MKKYPRLEYVPLESEFADEKTFTDWLADKETCALKTLSDCLGLDLSYEGQEVYTGQYRIDIVATSNDNNSRVIIENQITASNHSHLGQCLTYASAYDDCKTIIWIAKKFNEEHKRAINWLNKSWSDISFYAIEVKLIKIGKSECAPTFYVICQPDIGSRTMRIQENASDTGRFQIAFWQSYVNALKKVNIHSGRQVRNHAHYAVGVKSKWAYLNPRVSKRDGYVAIAIWVNHQRKQEDAEKVFKFLESHKQEIEAAAGEPLDWTQKEGGKIKTITLVKNDVDFENEDSLKFSMEWLVDKTAKLHKCLRKLLPKFNAECLTTQDSEDEQE